MINKQCWFFLPKISKNYTFPGAGRYTAKWWRIWSADIIYTPG